jgi:hypothetical protein
VRHLGEELSSFRRRALQAEARLKTLDAERQEREKSAPSSSAAAGPSAGPADPRVAELEAENAELRRRLELATSRTRKVLDRVRFLRQQSQGGER